MPYISPKSLRKSAPYSLSRWRIALKVVVLLAAHGFCTALFALQASFAMLAHESVQASIGFHRFLKLDIVGLPFGDIVEYMLRNETMPRRTETNEGECLDRANGEVGRVKS